jgi:hypothetical protein
MLQSKSTSRREGFHRPGLCADRRLDAPRYGLVKALVIPAVEWAWWRQSIWFQTVDKLKAGPHRLWGLGLTVAAAALALAGSQVKTVSVLASVDLAVAAALAARNRVWLTKAAQAGTSARKWGCTCSEMAN